MNGLNETGCYIKLGLKGLLETNALAYCAYLLVMKKMKGLKPEKVAQTIAKTKNTIGCEFESPKHLHQTTLET
jgi:hypothetical protein